eukprot:2147959-Alexandrium_andersonii.AAC.1
MEPLLAKFKRDPPESNTKLLPTAKSDRNATKNGFQHSNLQYFCETVGFDTKVGRGPPNEHGVSATSIDIAKFC